MTTARPWSTRVWVPVVAVLAAVFSLVIPRLPGYGPTDRPVVPDEPMYASFASFVPATGWSYNIESAVNASPEVALGDVTVRLDDGVWFGNTSDLLRRVAEQLERGGATVGSLPGAPTDDGLLSFDPEATEVAVVPRAEYVIDFSVGDSEGRLLVVREDVNVALLRETGSAAQLEEHAAALAAMESSVDTGIVTVDELPTGPQ